MIVFLGYFLLAAALTVAVWVLEVHPFRAKHVSTRTSAVQEDKNVADDSNDTENTYDHNKSSSKNIYLNTTEKDELYESDDEFVNTKYKTIDNHDNTMNNITSWQMKNDEDSKLSTSVEYDDADDEFLENSEELTNINITACSGYDFINDQSNKSMFNELNASYDISDITSNGVCSLDTSADFLAFSKGKLDNFESSDTQANTPTKDDNKDPDVMKSYFTHRMRNTKIYTSKENNYDKKTEQSFTDIFEQNDFSSDDEVNYSNFTGHTLTEISDENTEKSLKSNSYSSGYTESLPSTIFSDDNSIMDIKYVEDITDIAFCESDTTDILNKAFVGE